jgi:hypothetical protein
VALTAIVTIAVTNFMNRRSNGNGTSNGNGNGRTAKLVADAAVVAAQHVAERAAESNRLIDAKLDNHSMILNRICEALQPLNTLPVSQQRQVELLGEIKGLLSRRN